VLVVTHVDELKENISLTFLKYDE